MSKPGEENRGGPGTGGDKSKGTGDPVGDTSNPTAREVMAYIVWAAAFYGIPHAIALGVSQFESGFNHVGQNNGSGYWGPMQTNNANARGYGWKGGDVESASGWKNNIQAGLLELAAHFKKHGNWHDAYAAYNGGEGGWQGAKEQHNADAVIKAAEGYGWTGKSGNPKLLYAGIPSGATAPSTFASGSGGGGGTGGGGTGGGGGGGGTLADQIAKILGGGGKKTITSASPRNLWRSFQGYLQSIGLGQDPNAIGFAHQAAQNHWDLSEFQQALFSQPWFTAHFPGIYNADGSFKLSPEAYNLYYHRFQGLASTVDQQFNRQAFGHLLQSYHDVSIAYNQFAQRVQAVDAVESNRPLFRQFVGEARARGLLKPHQQVTDAQLFHMALGEAPQEWTSLWEEASLRAQAATAGLRIGADITRGMIHRLMQMHPEFRAAFAGGGTVNETKGFADLASKIKQFKQLSPAVGLKISNKELFNLEFGNPGPNLVAKAQNIVDTYQGLFEPQAESNLQQTGQGGTTMPGYAKFGG